jgi:hypothetical protein
MTSQVNSPKTVPPKLKWVGWSPSVFCGGVVLGGVALGTGLVVYCFDPSQTPFYPGCVFHQLTGWNCPGCGATRGLYALLHGHWRAALRDNALFVFTLAALAGRAGWLGAQALRHRPVPSLIPTRCLLPWLVAALLFGLLRNFPAFAFLSP